MRRKSACIVLWALVFASAPYVRAQQNSLDELLDRERRAVEAPPREPSNEERRPRERDRPAAEAPIEDDSESRAAEAGAALGSTPAGPRAQGARAIEEIIVTAQKTEQNIQDVPISMSVIGAEFMHEQSITDYRDLALYAPNVHVDPGNGIFPDINIRGFGSALSNKAFEQAVGLAIDGIPYGRAGYFQGPLFDLERIEVLRGPQGTLFGKNTTAGLMNVVTKKPSAELTGGVFLEYGELDRRRFEGAIGGPLFADIVNFRISGLHDERDGLVENTTARIAAGANERMNGRERTGGRFQLQVPNALGANILVSYEHVDFDFPGVGWEFDRIPEQMKAFYREYDPRTDFVRSNWIGSVNVPESNENSIDMFVGSIQYALGPWMMDLVSGYSLLEVEGVFDDDFGPQPMIVHRIVDDNPQTTVELRATSPTLPGLLGLRELFVPLGTSEWIAGFFFQRRDIKNSALAIDLNLPVLAQFIATNDAPPGTPLAPLQDFIGPAVPIGELGVFDTAGIHEESTMFFEQETTAIAGFSHLDWQFADRWSLQYGMRFTEEAKEAHWNRVTTRGTGAAFQVLGGQSEFTTSRSRSEFAFTPKVALRWDWTDEINFYTSWSEGVKAGGFNEQVFNTTDESLEFATEEATAYELGTRARLFGGAAMLNLTLFRQDVTNFQVLTVPPNSVSVIVVNAGEARAQGVELDTTWLATDWLTLLGTLAFNDSEFLEFPLGQCSFDRPDTDGNGDGRCDVSGEPLFRTPKWSTTMVANVRFPLASFLSDTKTLAGIDLVGGLTWEYQDVQYLERTFDERVRQSPFHRFGLNFGFASEARGWNARMVVENLTNEATDVLIRDVPSGGGNFAAIPEPQRLVFGSLQWTF